MKRAVVVNKTAKQTIEVIDKELRAVTLRWSVSNVSIVEFAHWFTRLRIMICNTELGPILGHEGVRSVSHPALMLITH